MDLNHKGGSYEKDAIVGKHIVYVAGCAIWVSYMLEHLFRNDNIEFLSECVARDIKFREVYDAMMCDALWVNNRPLTGGNFERLKGLKRQ